MCMKVSMMPSIVETLAFLSTNIMLPVHFILVSQGILAMIPARTPVLVDGGRIISVMLAT